MQAEWLGFQKALETEGTGGYQMREGNKLIHVDIKSGQRVPNILLHAATDS